MPIYRFVSIYKMIYFFEQIYPICIRKSYKINKAMDRPLVHIIHIYNIIFSKPIQSFFFFFKKKPSEINFIQKKIKIKKISYLKNKFSSKDNSLLPTTG